MPEASKDGRADTRPGMLRSLASKFSIFTATLVFWVVATLLAYDMRQENFNVAKGLLMCVIVILVSATISRFTIRLLARPLKLLEAGITSVRNGRLEPIQVSHTGDEIEFLGESFNGMIEALAESRREIREHQELLERRIKERTLQLEEATRRAQASSQAKSEFLADLSYDMRTPMNGIVGMLDLALSRHLAPEQVEELQAAQKSAQTLLSLLNDTVDLSKIEAGKLILQPAPFDIRTSAIECVKGYQTQAVANDIELRLEVTPDVPLQVTADPKRIRQILSNLIANALKFTEHGSVIVRLSKDPSGSGEFPLRIAVQDTGTGIAADKLLSLFDGADKSEIENKKLNAAGLGLVLTQKLVELLRGEIHVESELGRGSTFVVFIPCGGSPAGTQRGPVSEQAARPARDTSAGPGRILVVEDNPVNQKVVMAVLRKQGYDIELAGDGKQALAKLEKGAKFDLVLMDVQMPCLDGLEATRQIRKDERWKALPIVAMTAHAMVGDKERCLEAGMTGYMSKPVHASDLIALVEEYLANRAVV